MVAAAIGGAFSSALIGLGVILGYFDGVRYMVSIKR
jgi:hypothetical protein